ncbi:MAG TPA: DUF4349 domain-containing protein [Gemmatimonadaceae bacterium]|nr:DUF4349 domain-containing protein [Gemmatimonadaceae bacterium]
MPARIHVRGAAMAALIVATACGERTNGDGVKEEFQAGVVGYAPARDKSDGRRASAPAQLEAPAVARVVVTSAQAAPPSPVQRIPSASTSLIIRNGDVSIQVDSVQLAIESVRRVAASVGGYIGNVQTFTGEHQVHSATLDMKVPAARFDDALAGIRPIGEVERSSASAEDVGEEFVDVSARITNGKRLEERLVRLLETRTGRLSDVLSIERELARVREEIERYEGRIRYLSAHIAVSTISVTVHEKLPLVAQIPGRNPIRVALVGMWRNMVRVVAVGIETLGVVIPPLALALIGVLIWRRTRRRTIVAAS